MGYLSDKDKKNGMDNCSNKFKSMSNKKKKKKCISLREIISSEQIVKKKKLTRYNNNTKEKREIEGIKMDQMPKYFIY